MVKSPVEGSTAALVRLETPVVYSDFVRPICLSDEMNEVFRQVQEPATNANQINRKRDSPYADKLEVTLPPASSKTGVTNQDNKKGWTIKDNREYFEYPLLQLDPSSDSSSDKEFNVNFTDDAEEMPKAEALLAAVKPTLEYPLPKESPQTSGFKKVPQYSQPQLSIAHYAKTAQRAINDRQTAQQWTNCNTLGWTRMKNHLQRVQLKIGDMSACENVSIATVNSMCGEAINHKQDCSVSEGSGLILLLWANF